MKKKTIRRKNRTQRLLNNGTLAHKFNAGMGLTGGGGTMPHVEKVNASEGHKNAKMEHTDTKTSTVLPYYVKDAVINRSGGMCEVANCEFGGGCGFDYSHIVHRGMGGRKGCFVELINDPRNIVYLCRKHHDMLDRRTKCDIKYWQWLSEHLKYKIGHDGWLQEYRQLGGK